MEWSRVFQFSMENALEMMLIFDIQGEILYANPAAENLLKYKNTVCGNQITEVFPNLEEIKRWYQMEEETREIHSLMAYRGNRTCFPVKAKIIFCPWKYQERQVYLCVASDISAENYLEKQVDKVEEEAKNAAKVKSEFVANVTHELRTPVNGILGNAQELISMEQETEKLKLLQLIERGCKDMNALINNILDFSKLESGKFTLESRQFCFRTMIDYVKGNHNKRMIEKGLDFTINVSSEIPQCIIGDELRIVQILNNLISNAYKFTQVGGVHVEIVKTSQVGRRAELFFIVSDTGIGIAPQDQDKLFHSFSQVDMSITRKYGGTGLGLNICKQLVELMGGNIHVQSDVGKGTMFSFHIWVELPEDCEGVQNVNGDTICSTAKSTGDVEKELMEKLQHITESQMNSAVWKYGEAQNRTEIDKKISKLMLSVVMENWEKAENLAEAVKQLVEEAPREVKSAAFRMKMSVQKGDVKKATEAIEKLQKIMEDSYGNGE